MAEITLADGRRVLDLCANNYLGLADHPRLIEAAKMAPNTYGFGMAPGQCGEVACFWS